MSKSFLKFKRKVRMHAILSSLLFGLGSGLLAFSTLLLVAKLSGNGVLFLHYLLSAIGAVAVYSALYFILMPSDKRLAKRLDSLYSLDEKVSTMIELKDSNDFFAELQREDADERLAAKPAKEFKSKPLVAGLLVLVISLGAVVGSWIVPAKAEAGEAPINEFDKQWLITAIEDLITEVEESYAQDSLKTSTVRELTSLLNFVKESELLSEMKAKAITTVIAISRNLKSTNSAEAIAEQFLKSADANVAALGKELKSLSGGSSKKALATLGAEISKASADDASFTADEINAYLQNSGVRSDDAVYRLFGNLIIAVKADHSKAKSEFESAGSDLSTAVIEQNVNKSTVNSVINKLCNLFGITESDITETAPDVDVDLRDPSDAPPTPDDSEVEEPDVDISSGGLGTGDVIYGSNDLVFDPYTNTYRPYGEILNDYFAKANEQITDGKTSDEVSDAAEEYFGALFGGSN